MPDLIDGEPLFNVHEFYCKSPDTLLKWIESLKGEGWNIIEIKENSFKAVGY